MAIWYVDGWNGNDANSGVDWANAVATLAQAYSLSTTTDTIYTRGVFNEVLPVTTIYDKRKWYGLGQTVVDGRGGLNGASTSRDTLVIHDILFCNWSIDYAIRFYDGGTTTHGTLKRCTFQDCLVGVEIYTGGNDQKNARLEECVLLRNGTGIQFNSDGNTSSDAVLRLHNSLFKGNTRNLHLTNIPSSVPHKVAEMSHNIFLDGIIDFATADASLSTVYDIADFNIYNFTGGGLTVEDSGGTYSTLAAWQARTGQDANSTDDDDSDLGDAEHFAVHPSMGSPLLTAGIADLPLGLRTPRVVISENSNASIWTGATRVNCLLNGASEFVKDAAGPFSIETLAIDLGAGRGMKKLFAPATLTDGGTLDEFMEMKFSDTEAGLTSASWQNVRLGQLIAEAVGADSEKQWVKIKIKGVWV